MREGWGFLDNVSVAFFYEPKTMSKSYCERGHICQCFVNNAVGIWGGMQDRVIKSKNSV